MFSTLSSYIWGEETQSEQVAPASVNEEVVKKTRDPSPDDWILVGESSAPAPGNLAGGLPPLPGDSTPSQSSSASSEAGDVVAVAPEPAAVGPGVKHRSHCSVANVTKKEMKSIKSSQLIKQKNSGKALTSKALNKHNKTVYANNTNNKRHHVKQNLNIKMAGANKNLKQC